MHLANCSFALFERDMFYLYFLPCGLLIDHIPSPMFKGELLTRTSPGLPSVLTHWGLGKKLPRVLQTQLTAPPDAPPKALWQSIARDSVLCPALVTSAPLPGLITFQNRSEPTHCQNIEFTEAFKAGHSKWRSQSFYFWKSAWRT